MDQRKLLVWQSDSAKQNRNASTYEMKQQQIARQSADFSTKRLSKQLLGEIKKSLKSIKGYGSVEIIIQDHHVVQISERNIKKTLNSNLNRS